MSGRNDDTVIGAHGVRPDSCPDSRPCCSELAFQSAPTVARLPLSRACSLAAMAQEGPGFASYHDFRQASTWLSGAPGAASLSNDVKLEACRVPCWAGPLSDLGLSYTVFSSF